MRPLACLLLVVPYTLAVDPPKFTTPEPDFIADDLRAPGDADKKYPLPQDEAVARKMREDRLKFYRDQFVKPLESGAGAQAKWAAQARTALEAAAGYYATGIVRQRRNEAFTKMEAAMKAAIDAGCDDPVVQTIHDRHVPKKEIAIEKAEAYADLLKRLKAANAPMVPQVICSQGRALALQAASDKNLSFRKDARKAFEDAITVVGAAAKNKSRFMEEFLLMYSAQIGDSYQVAGWGRPFAEEALTAALEENSASIYFLKTMKGKFEIAHAWDARGPGSAQDIPTENINQFKSHLREADKALKAAFAEKAERTDAPTAMLSVCMGLNYNRKVMEDWFTRAMKADPDNYQACTRKLLYLEPKWYGTVEDCYAFGRQCMRTKNWHAGLPFILARAHAETSNGSLHAHVAQHEIAWADVREVYEQQLLASPNDLVSRGEFARFCVTMKLWKPAQEHLKPLKDTLPLSVFPNGKKDYDAFMKRISDELAAEKKK